MPTDNTTSKQEVDCGSLESQVKHMYQKVADDPSGEQRHWRGRQVGGEERLIASG